MGANEDHKFVPGSKTSRVAKGGMFNGNAVSNTAGDVELAIDHPASSALAGGRHARLRRPTVCGCVIGSEGVDLYAAIGAAGEVQDPINDAGRGVRLRAQH